MNGSMAIKFAAEPPIWFEFEDVRTDGSPGNDALAIVADSPHFKTSLKFYFIEVKRAR